MVKEYWLYKCYMKQQLRSFSKFSSYSYLFFVLLFSIFFSLLIYSGFRIDDRKGIDTSVNGVILLYIFILFSSHIIHYIRSNKVDKSQLALLPVSDLRLYFILLASDIISLKNLPSVAMVIVACTYFNSYIWNWGIAFLYFLLILISVVVWLQNIFAILDLFKINLRSILRYIFSLTIFILIWTGVLDSIEKNYVPLLPFKFLVNLLIYNKFAGESFFVETGILLLILCIGLSFGYVLTKLFLRPE